MLKCTFETSFYTKINFAKSCAVNFLCNQINKQNFALFQEYNHPLCGKRNRHYRIRHHRALLTFRALGTG